MKPIKYLAAGIALGVSLAAFFAPKSGEETRRWIANKFLDAIEAANQKLWQSRFQLSEKLNRGQLQISQVVAAGRAAVGHASKGFAHPVALL